MPELPEVQTVINGIKPKIIGKKIISFSSYIEKLRYPISKFISKRIIQSKVCEIQRRAKYIIMHLSNGESVIIHLGMSGRIVISESSKNYLFKHTHFVIRFSENIELQYIDPRRFGLIVVERSDILLQSRFFNQLGVEPLTKKFNKKYLQTICESKYTSIKSTIMDQKYVVGIGNIYASESLFLSKINPNRACITLSEKECSLLVSSIKKILRKSIKSGGSSINDYVMVTGKLGNYQNKLKVYRREGLICRKRSCQSKILRIIIAQRSTFYCPICQV